ncbi:MAG: hypothetical protein ABI995_16200, partial [Acidobacteriota bacterium]
MRTLLIMVTLMGTLRGETLFDQFFQEYYFPYNPTAATYAGVHEFDGKLEDYSRSGREQRTGLLDYWLVAFSSMPTPVDSAGKADL